MRKRLPLGSQKKHLEWQEGRQKEPASGPEAGTKNRRCSRTERRPLMLDGIKKEGDEVRMVGPIHSLG